MGGNMTQIIIMVIMLICSGYFSATETAFSTLNKTRIKTISEKGNKKAETVLSLSENYDKLISAILIGNNIVNIFLSSICTVFFINLLKGNQSLGTTVATIVSTVGVLIFGEICPKMLARQFPESFAMFSAPIIKCIMFILFPLTVVFGSVRIVLSKIFKSGDDHKMTQDELLTFVDEVEQEGGIDKEESALLRSAIEFTDREASDILTPRTSLEAIEENMPNSEIESVFNDTGYSRLPVYAGSIDSIVGIINQKDFFAKVVGTDRSIKEIMNKPVYIPLSMKISDILKLLQKNKSHIAIVVDEYGGTNGIVTMEDILEELVGEIWDEHDEVVQDFIQLDENTYKVLCTMELDKMFKFFDLEDETDSVTVSGWVLEKFGCFPHEGERFEFENIAVEVTSADDQRVNEIIVTVKPQNEEESEEEE